MLTPIDVRQMKDAVQARVKSELATTAVPGMVCKLEMTFYMEVLKEIARGSIDAKSLARAALEPEEKF